MSADYSVPNCPWCGMASQSKPEHHHEWETVHMECGSEIYPPRATTPSQQSEACKIIASTTADRDALRAEVEALRHEVELTNEHEHQILTERNEARAELERTKEELERVRRNHLRNQLRRAELAAKTFAYVARQDPAHSTSTPRRLRRAARNRDRWRKVVEAIRAALERKDGASHGA